jgi:hypothetical protein
VRSKGAMTWIFQSKSRKKKRKKTNRIQEAKTFSSVPPLTDPRDGDTLSVAIGSIDK